MISMSHEPSNLTLCILLHCLTTRPFWSHSTTSSTMSRQTELLSERSPHRALKTPGTEPHAARPFGPLRAPSAPFGLLRPSSGPARADLPRDGGVLPELSKDRLLAAQVHHVWLGRGTGGGRAEGGRNGRSEGWSIGV